GRECPQSSTRGEGHRGGRGRGGGAIAAGGKRGNGCRAGPRRPRRGGRVGVRAALRAGREECHRSDEAKHRPTPANPPVRHGTIVAQPDVGGQPGTATTEAMPVGSYGTLIGSPGHCSARLVAMAKPDTCVEERSGRPPT